MAQKILTDVPPVFLYRTQPLPWVKTRGFKKSHVAPMKSHSGSGRPSPITIRIALLRLRKIPLHPGVSVHSRRTISVSINRRSVSHNGGKDHAKQPSK